MAMSFFFVHIHASESPEKQKKEINTAGPFLPPSQPEV